MSEEIESKRLEKISLADAYQQENFPTKDKDYTAKHLRYAFIAGYTEAEKKYEDILRNCLEQINKLVCDLVGIKE